MKIILFIYVISISLFANCYPMDAENKKIDVIEAGELNCINVGNNEICLQRDVVKKKITGSQEYHAICINGERVAERYPKLKNRTTKSVEWKSNENFEVDDNSLIFHIDHNTYRYDFKQKNFIKLELPSNIIRFIPINHNHMGIQYLDKTQSTIKLMFINTYTFDKYYVDSTDHAIFRKKITVDIVKKEDPNFITKYLDVKTETNSKFNRLISKKHDAESKKLTTIFKPTNTPITNTITIQKDLTTNNIHSFILNKSLEIISKRSFQMNQNEYFKLLSSEFGNLPTFVHGNLSLLIIFITLLGGVLSYIFLKYLVGGFKLPTIASFFMLFYAVIIVIGATFLNTFYFEYEYNMNFYERKDLLLNIWIYAVSGLLLIPLGMYVASLLFRYNAKKNFNHFIDQKINYGHENKLFYITLFFMSVALIVLWIYIGKLGHVPLFGVLQNMLPEELASLRSSAGFNFDGKVYRYMFFIKTIPLLFLLISFIYKSVNKKWFLLFIGILFYNIFVNIMDLRKAPVIELLLLLLITHFYIMGKINWKQISLFLLFSIGLLFIMYISFMGISSRGLLQTLQNPFHRAFIGTVSPVFWWQLYVEQYGYLNGLSLPNPKHIFDFEHVKISVEIMKFVHPELQDKGIVGSMPAVFWADWFINFGVYTIFFSMILFGFLIQSLDILFINYMKNKKTILILALFTYTIFYFKRYIATTYFGIMIDLNIILPIIFIFSLNYVLQKNRKKKT